MLDSCGGSCFWLVCILFLELVFAESLIGCNFFSSVSLVLNIASSCFPPHRTKLLPCQPGKCQWVVAFFLIGILSNVLFCPCMVFLFTRNKNQDDSGFGGKEASPASNASNVGKKTSLCPTQFPRFLKWI